MTTTHSKRQRQNQPQGAALYGILIEFAPPTSRWREPHFLCQDIVARLRAATVRGRRVIDVIYSGETNRIQVPCFGHNSKCERHGCRQPVAGGVWRVFGYSLIIEGPPDRDLLGTYGLNRMQRVEIVSVAHPEVDEKRKALLEIGELS